MAHLQTMHLLKFLVCACVGDRMIPCAQKHNPLFGQQLKGVFFTFHIFFQKTELQVGNNKTKSKLYCT